MRDLGVLTGTTLLFELDGGQGPAERGPAETLSPFPVASSTTGTSEPSLVPTPRRTPLWGLDLRTRESEDVIEQAWPLTEHLCGTFRVRFERAGTRTGQSCGIHCGSRRDSYGASTTTRTRRIRVRQRTVDAAQNAILGGAARRPAHRGNGRPTHSRHRARDGRRTDAHRRRRARCSGGADSHPDVFVIERAHRRAAERLADPGAAGGRPPGQAVVPGNRSASAQRKAAERARPALECVVLHPRAFGRARLSCGSRRHIEEMDVPRDQLAAWVRDDCEFDR